MSISRTALQSICVSLFAGAQLISIALGVDLAYGETTQRPEFFVHSEEIPFYNQPYSALSKRMRWRRKIHGLRMTALDPRVWLMRLVDRTDNRVLVPIRPYYLEASTRGDFRLRRVSLKFQYWGINQRAIQKSPETSSGVFDLGFSGQYVPGAHGRRPEIDRSYALRLSMFPPVPSGIIYRSQRSSTMIQPATRSVLQAQTPYTLEFTVDQESARASIDGQVFAEIEGANLDTGLVSLTGDWHPLIISELRIEGELRVGESVKQVVYGGLVPTR